MRSAGILALYPSATHLRILASFADDPMCVAAVCGTLTTWPRCEAEATLVSLKQSDKTDKTSSAISSDGAVHVAVAGAG